MIHVSNIESLEIISSHANTNWNKKTKEKSNIKDWARLNYRLQHSLNEFRLWDYKLDSEEPTGTLATLF